MKIEEVLARDFCSVPELIRMHAAGRPHHAALVQDDRKLDYAGLDALMDRVAVSLQRDGLKPGDVIAICAGTSIEYGAAFLGALRAGVAVAPLASSSTAASLAAMAADAGAKLLFLDEAAATTLDQVRGRVAAKRVALDGCAAAEPLHAWLAPAHTAPEHVAIRPDWPFNIIYSSGTTGAPKGIVQAHAMRWTQLQRVTNFSYGPQSVTLVSTPLYSNTTLVSFLPTVATGGTAVLMAKFDAAGFLALAERHRVTHGMLVPVQYQRIMMLPDFGRHDLSSFRFKFCTSAPFAPALKADVVKRWPGALIEYYGMTEGGGTCILEAHACPNKLHTVGRPAQGHDLRLIDEQGRELPRGATGEIVGHSAGMMEGYHNQPARTAEAQWHDAAGKRFIRTGDIGRFDEEGFLILLDRRKDMIISGGFNVYPSDIEAVLRDHAEVADVAVVGVPSERWGETPVAFVVRKPGAATAAGDLRDWANHRLGKTQRLAAVEFIAALPRSGIGKVLKRELRDRYREKSAAPL